MKKTRGELLLLLQVRLRRAKKIGPDEILTEQHIFKQSKWHVVPRGVLVVFISLDDLDHASHWVEGQMLGGPPWRDQPNWGGFSGVAEYLDWLLEIQEKALAAAAPGIAP